MTLVRSGRVIGVRVHAHRGTAGSRNRQRKLTSAKHFQPYIVLNLPHDPHTILVFHWSRLAHTQYLFFINRDLYPRNACSPLVTAYPNVFLVSGNHFVDFINGRMNPSVTSTGFLAGQGDILHKLIGVFQLLSNKNRRNHVWWDAVGSYPPHMCIWP